MTAFGRFLPFVTGRNRPGSDIWSGEIISSHFFPAWQFVDALLHTHIWETRV